MNEPTLETFDNLRAEGFRPGVVACILHNRKLLMFYKNDHKIWQLPQGGIANNEDYKQALKREMQEELGDKLSASLKYETAQIIDEDRMEFKPGRHNVEELTTDSGKVHQMIGKHYFFCLVESEIKEFDISQTQFDQYFWVTFREAYFLANKMYQKGKRRITLKILTKLQKLEVIE